MASLRLTYTELGERLGLSPEAARQRAKRRQREGRWSITIGNEDGKARVLLEEADLADEVPVRAPKRTADDRGNVPPDNSELVVELRAERDKAREEAETLRHELRKAGERAAGAEGEARALREALADLSARLDRAEAVLAQPWWKRLFG
jgi:hypothetical protein